MTKLFEQAISEVSRLPDIEQDAIASLILEELADEQLWQQQFGQSQDALARLANKVRSDIRTGRVREMGIDEL